MIKVIKQWTKCFCSRMDRSFMHSFITTHLRAKNKVT